MILSLDTETTGIDLWHGARPFLVTMCDESDNNIWWEWRVNALTRTVSVVQDDLLEILDWIRSADTLVLQNPKFDFIGLYLTCKDLGLEDSFLEAWNWDKVRDTLTYGHVLASNQPHDLTAMALHYLGVDTQPYEDKVVEAAKKARDWAKKHRPDWMIAKAGLPCMPSAKEKVAKFDMWLPRRVLAAGGGDSSWETVCADYANTDSLVTLHLYKKQVELLKERDLLEIAHSKAAVIGILARMEIEGITYNEPRRQELTRKYADEAYDCAKVCYEIADNYGVELELPKGGVNNSLSSFVFDHLKVPVLKRGDSGKPSLDKSVVTEYLSMFDRETEQHQFFKALSDKRSRDTAITYMEGYDRHSLPIHRLKPQWRHLHPNVNPNGSDTLRFSSSNPNEQNISKKEGFNLRYIFGPMRGQVWYSIDYENLELKIPAYEAGEDVMIEIFEKPNEPPYFGSYHLLNASIVYPDEFWPIADEEGLFKKKYKATLYQWIKNFGFAIQYGAQEATADRAAHKVGAFKAVKAKLQKIEALNQRCIDRANKYGYVETIPDKAVNPNRGYPLLCRRSSWGSISPTLPLNYHVQGTACMIMIQAMIQVQEFFDNISASDAHIVMNIHDELVIDAPDNRAGELDAYICKELMEKVGDRFGIPLTCGLTVHKNNWSEE